MIKVIFLTLFSWLNVSKPTDSLRLETINGKQFIIHQIVEKETLYSISRRYGSPITGILEANPTADSGLEIGQQLKIPYIPKPKTSLPGGVIHKVQPKETLFSISKLYNVSVEYLKNWNYLTENSVSVGQELRVKKPDSFTETKTPDAKGTHTVLSGETLFSISRDFRVSVDQLREWNNLQPSSGLKVGQVLKVESPAGKNTVENKITTTANNSNSPNSTKKNSTDGVQISTIKDQNTNNNTETVTTAKTETVIKISENVAGTDEVREGGLAELIEGTEGNRKYLAMHRTVKPGTILKVRNELNNREVFVRVVGNLPSTGVNDKLIIKISKSAYDRLGAIDPRFRVEVTYYK